MFLFEKRIYTLNTKSFFKYSYYFYLVNHIGNEMIKQATLYDIKITRVRSKNVLHRSKVYLLTSNVQNKTFDYNNYTNMLNKNGVKTYILYHSNLYFKHTGVNMKKTIQTSLLCLKTSNKLLLATLFSGIDVTRVKCFILFTVISYLYISIKQYITALYSNVNKQIMYNNLIL